MKKYLTLTVSCLCMMSAFGQVAIPDTIYIYETVMVYDTIVIHDTIRAKKVMNFRVLEPINIGVDGVLRESFTENVLILHETGKVQTTSTKKNFEIMPDPNIISSSPHATFSENRIILHESKPYQKQKNMRTMKLDLAEYLSAIILTAQTFSGISAQETKPVEELTTFPIQFSLVYPLTTQGEQTVNYRYNVSFNLFSGKVGAVKGVEYGSFFNQVENGVKGVQFAGLANQSHNITGIQFGGLANRTQDVTGIQFGGLGNVAHTVNGIQFGGLGNVAKTVTGVQFGGITNIADSVLGVHFGGIANISKKITGIQFAGIANLNEYTNGAQFAGIVNVAEKTEGIQFAGITNISQEVTGASFGGIFNRTGTLRGVQFGVVNVIDTIEKGFSVALVNIVKKDFYNEWSLSFADYQNVGLSYKMGTQKFYTILTAGANFMKDKLWVFGYGFGNRTVLNKRFDFQPEIVSYQYFPQNFRDIQNTTATYLKIGFVYKFNEKFGMVIAPSIYQFHCDLYGSGHAYKISPIKELYSKQSHDNYYIAYGVGISVGLLLR